MSEIGNVEIKRETQFQEFKTKCREFKTELSFIFGNQNVEISFNKLTQSNNPNFYYLSVSFNIPSALDLLSFVWDPNKKTLNKIATYIDKDSTGKGYGTQINQISEKLARNLGASFFKISTITNQRWKKTLIEQGFEQDKEVADTVYKKIQ